MTDDHDPIIDACLEELLGGSKPPDVSEAVLREWSHRKENPELLAYLPADEGLALDPLLPPVCDAPPIAVTSAPQIDRIVRSNPPAIAANRSRQIPVWIGAAVALSLVLLISVGVLIRRDRQQDSAQGPKSLPAMTDSEIVNRNVVEQPEQKSDVQVAKNPKTESQPIQQKSPSSPSPGSPLDSPPLVPNFGEQNRFSAETLIASSPIPDPLSSQLVVEKINSAVRALWSQNELSTPARISDAAWRQRVFQVLLGRAPTDADLTRFGKTATLAQREQMVASLMNSEPYLEEFARRWGTVLTATFLSDDIDEVSMANREGMLQYFRRAMLEGRRFDEVAKDLLTATGSGQPGMADYNGAANYLLARVQTTGEPQTTKTGEPSGVSPQTTKTGEPGGVSPRTKIRIAGNLEKATADTSRLLLGRNIECQQCHDDLRDSPRQQSEFWEFNSFFRQLALTPSDEPGKAASLTNVDFLGEDKSDGRSAIVFFERPDGVLKSAFPAFSNQRELPRSGLLAESDRRQLLARCVITSVDFRRAMTNRLWAGIYGTGLASVDDLSVGDPSLRVLLGELGDQFAAHQFNPRQVLAWAVLSECFAVPAAETSSLVKRDTAMFHRFAESPAVTRRPVLESLLAVSKTFGQNEVNSATTAKIESTPIPSTKNGKGIFDVPSTKPLFDRTVATADPLVRQVLANSKLSNQQKAQHLFQLVLHRQPKRRELDVVERLLTKAGDKPESAWDSVWSALHDSVR